MRQYARESFICTVMFCLGYLVACQSGSTVTKGSSVGSNSSGTITQMIMGRGFRPVALTQNGNSGHPAFAAAFWGADSVHPNATIANPSGVAQSYESDCGNTGGTSPGIHSTFGNSGLLSVTYAYAFWGPCSSLKELTSVGGDENGNPQGYPVVLDGTINTLVMYGTFVSGKRFECVDSTNTTPLSDGSFVRAYYDLAHDAVILGSGTTQLSPTCNISIPSGDDVIEIHVQWLKS